MFDKEKFTSEFYDKLSDSEKKELVQIMSEDQLTDPLHIKGLPKPVQYSIKSAVKRSAKNMKEETMARYPVEWINGIKSKDETGEKTLNVWDKPYPVMTPKDEKMMRGMSDEIRKKFQDYVSETLDVPQPMSGVTIQRLLSARYLLRDESSPRMLPVDFDCPANTYMYSISDDGDVTITGATQNFKPVQSYDNLKVLLDILDIEDPDKNGRIWTKEMINEFLNSRIYLTAPRARKSWLWLKFLELQKSYEVRLQKTLGTTPSTKFELKSVIHMRWPKPALSNLKARDFRYGKMWQDQELINYATGDVSHIDTIILDSLAMFGPHINSGYDMSTPNLNDINKKKLERVIKRRKKK